ncbi:MAG: site-specific DNA-methyltransferase [Alphaproteobacteria bacterium]|nr:site-specific DNA-methyltransferase [Alphaproteobacteria bacterium]
MGKDKVDFIMQGDCVANMKKLPDASVDLIFADPPYYMQLGGELNRPDASSVKSVDDAWDKFDSFQAYDTFSKEWISEAKRIMKPDASFWVIGSYHNIFRIGNLLQDLGFWIRNDIIWVKNNPMPNFKGTRFTNAHETLLWCTKSKDSRPTFNYHAMKIFNDDKQMRSDWNLPICSGSERFRDKDGASIHSTQKPKALLYRVILSTSNTGDVVLDPFFGSGTTGVVAKELGRHYIGLEKEEKYINVAQQRIAEVSAPDEKILSMTQKNPPVKVPFGSLLTQGLIHAGDTLFAKNGTVKATVRVDGSLKTASGVEGSIHKVGATVQNKSACNGWSFWSVSKNGEDVSIDTLRHQIAKKAA